MTKKFERKMAESGKPSWDLCRIGRAKEIVDLCPNTIRAYARRGLQIYNCGKVTLFSVRELEAFVRSRTPKSRRKIADQEEGNSNI
jgi:hypothetical protein